jgi:hypothetical protein
VRDRGDLIRAAFVAPDIVESIAKGRSPSVLRQKQSHHIEIARVVHVEKRSAYSVALLDQCGSNDEPFVAIMQSVDLRYGNVTSLLLRVYESDAGTPRKSSLLRANLDEGRRCLRPARIHREAPPHARVTARRSVRQSQRERRAVIPWLLRHPIGRSIDNPQQSVSPIGCSCWWSVWRQRDYRSTADHLGLAPPGFVMCSGGSAAAIMTGWATVRECIARHNTKRSLWPYEKFVRETANTVPH